MTRVRVYEKQWGEIEMDYVKYFKSWEEALKYSEETGNKVEKA